MSHKEEAENQRDHPSDLEESIRCKKDQAARCIYIPNATSPHQSPQQPRKNQVSAGLGRDYHKAIC